MSQNGDDNQLRPHTWCWESFALEYMAEMATTGGASDLYARHAQRLVFMSTDGSWNSCIAR